MTRAQIVDSIFEEMHSLPKKEIDTIIINLLGTISDNLQKGEAIYFRGFEQLQEKKGLPGT